MAILLKDNFVLFFVVAQCQLKHMYAFLENTTSQCRTTEKIKISYCAGKCGDSVSKPALLNTRPVGNLNSLFHNQCSCCQGKAAKIKEVIALCGPDQTESVLYYPQICSCECSRCQ